MTDALYRLPLALRGFGLLLAGVLAAVCIVAAAAVAVLVTVAYAGRALVRPRRDRRVPSAPTSAVPGAAARVTGGTHRVRDAAAAARA